MLDPHATAQRHAANLARLAELGMALVEQVAQDAQAAETPEARAEAARTFHTLSRSIRQSMALEARVVRDALRCDAEMEAKVAQVAEQAAQAVKTARRSQAKRTLDRLVWTEWEDMDPSEALRLHHHVSRALDHTDLCDDEPLEPQLLRLMAELGYEIPQDPPSLNGEGQAREASQGGEAWTSPVCAALYPGGPTPTLGPNGEMLFNGRLAPPVDDG